MGPARALVSSSSSPTALFPFALLYFPRIPSIRHSAQAPFPNMSSQKIKEYVIWVGGPTLVLFLFIVCLWQAGNLHDYLRKKRKLRLAQKNNEDPEQRPPCYQSRSSTAVGAEAGGQGGR
ncbi:hypothetical protein HRG_008355 [Hirsutella rhossiliensis]|uniref:Uncharacterized protein n=1 Tax=Hirsutella rhossiliensis TaxID=111463 RepID=A0A9P8SG87_9HYPO|nr:uncharacterized protein HRG_08355 [Hirsutella rhossiliensis]KAH0960200.1 hypothetical protein HRG_08355 [Hirsutella rhossiliensis]